MLTLMMMLPFIKDSTSCTKPNLIPNLYPSNLIKSFIPYNSPHSFPLIQKVVILPSSVFILSIITTHLFNPIQISQKYIIFHRYPLSYRPFIHHLPSPKINHPFTINGAWFIYLFFTRICPRFITSDSNKLHNLIPGLPLQYNIYPLILVIINLFLSIYNTIYLSLRIYYQILYHFNSIIKHFKIRNSIITINFIQYFSTDYTINLYIDTIIFPETFQCHGISVSSCLYIVVVLFIYFYCQ